MSMVWPTLGSRMAKEQNTIIPPPIGDRSSVTSHICPWVHTPYICPNAILGITRPNFTKFLRILFVAATSHFLIMGPMAACRYRCSDVAAVSSAG